NCSPWACVTERPTRAVGGGRDARGSVTAIVAEVADSKCRSSSASRRGTSRDRRHPSRRPGSVRNRVGHIPQLLRQRRTGGFIDTPLPVGPSIPANAPRKLLVSRVHPCTCARRVVPSRDREGAGGDSPLPRGSVKNSPNGIGVSLVDKHLRQPLVDF